MRHCTLTTSATFRTSKAALVTVMVTALMALSVQHAPSARAAIADKIAPAAAAVGNGITISGDLLSAVDGVTFLGDAVLGDEVAAPHFIILDPKKLVVQVPPGAKSGPVRLHEGAVTTDTVASFTLLAPPVITGLSATSGVPNEQVTITGSNLLGLKKPKVLLGKKTAKPLDGATNESMTVIVPAGLNGGPADFSVQTTGGTASFGFYVAPAIKAVAPKGGSTAGGTVVSISGAGFTGADNFIDDPATTGVNERYNGVTVDGVNVTRLISVSDKEIVAQMPAGTGDVNGNASVLVRTRATPGYAAEATSPVAGTFLYKPVPSVTSVSQDWNVVDAPTPVVLRGTNFSASTRIFVGSIEVSDEDTDPATITVTPPVSTKAALTKITLTNTVGTLAHSTTVPFAYFAAVPPTVTKIAPIAGPENTTVSISGTGFANNSTVTFGTTPAKCTVVSHVLIRCGAPAGTGAADVAVTTDLGVGLSATKFTHSDIVVKPASTDPVVKALVPAYGTPGSTIGIVGANLASVKKVEFSAASGGYVEAPHFLTVAAGRLVVTVPQGAGNGQLRITASDDRVYYSDARVFAATVRPSITSIDMVGATTTGATPGDLLTIRGAGLYVRPVKTLVTIGGKPAPVQTKPTARPDIIVVKVPASVGGREPVVVTTPLGSATAFDDIYFVPELKGAKPLTTYRRGGTIVTIGGINFTGADSVSPRLSAVQFGGVPVAKMVVMSDKTLVVVTAADSASADEMVVITAHGAALGDSEGRVLPTTPPVPVISGLTPTSTPTSVSPATVTITGREFSDGSVVRFGGAAATVLNASTDGTTLTVLPPPSNVHGTVAVSVTNTVNGLTETVTLPDAYSYVRAAPAITGMSATTAPAYSAFTISGTSFVDVSSVTIGGVAIPYTVGNDRTIFATVPLTPSGKAGVTEPVVVTNATGPSTTAVNWTWDARPTITSMSAGADAKGVVGGEGSTVTISGTSFIGATAIRFGSTPAASFAVVNDTTMTAVVPVSPSAGTLADVTIQGSDGQWSRPPLTESANDWTWVRPAVITSMAPLNTTTGVTTAAAGTTVTVTGSQMTTVRRVYIEQGSSTPLDVTASVVVVDANTLTFTVPARPATVAYRTERNVVIVNASGAKSNGATSTANLFTWG